MRYLGVAVVLILSLSSLFISRVSIAGKVIGGRPALSNEYPAVVRLDILGATCTGTIISKNAILTAAHCLMSLYGWSGELETRIDLPIRAFEPIKVFPELSKNRKLKAIHLHPKFKNEATGAERHSHDLAILEYETELPKWRSQFEFDAKMRIGDSIEFVGFGNSQAKVSGCDVNESATGVKHVGKSQIAQMLSTLGIMESRREVIETWNPFDLPLKYDGNFANVGRGDSGGPVFSYGKIIGVIAYGITETNCTFPTGVIRTGWVDLSVPENRKFIERFL